MRTQYNINNDSIESVEIEATYGKASSVPRIGQRKRMKVNGSAQLMTLNELKLVRRAVWDEGHEKFSYVFDAKETWGEFYIS